MSTDGTENSTNEQNTQNDTGKKPNINKFGGKKFETKEILVEAFEGLVIEGKKDGISGSNDNFA